MVDDDTDTLSMLELLLGSIGWEVEVSESGEAALGLLAESSPDVVLSDLGMPEMDGYDFVSEIRTRHPSAASRSSGFCVVARPR